MDRRPRRRAVRAGLHSRHHLAHLVVADDRCRRTLRRLGRRDHRHHGRDRRIGGLSDRPLSRAPRFTHCSNGGGYFPRSTTQWPRKADRSSRCCASALGAAQSSELPIGRHRCLVPGLRLSDLSGDHPGHGALHVYFRRTRQGCGERRRFRRDVKMGPLRHRAAGDRGGCLSRDPKSDGKAQGSGSRRSKPMMYLFISP